MRYSGYRALFFFLVIVGNLAVAKNLTVSKKKLLSWPRANAGEFGCFLEKVFHSRDLKFNCGLKHYMNKADPCQDAQYYEGPKFPADKAREVHPLVEAVDLSWEHGDLQAITVTLKGKLSEKAAKELFHIDKKSIAAHPNVQSISTQECAAEKTCLLLTGFDHMGAGDLECGDGSGS